MIVPVKTDHRKTRKAGHKPFPRLGNAPADPNPFRQPIRPRIGIRRWRALIGRSDRSLREVPAKLTDFPLFQKLLYERLHSSKELGRCI